MLRRLRAFLVLSVILIPAVAVAEEAAPEATDSPASEGQESAPASPAPAGVTPTATAPAPFAPAPTTDAEAPTAAAKPGALLEGWHTEFHGYFRAPMALGISSRPTPSRDAEGNLTLAGPSQVQISYGPNRVMDWSYYSFAYTRLQEQDWAEVIFHAKKRHVDAAVGWMGYWLSAAGYRNPDAAAVPGIAYLALDTDFEVAGVKPNLTFTMGAWWPGYGYFEKYDTYTLGRFRQIGEQLKLTVPLNPDLTATLVEGFGTARDGKFGYDIANNNTLYAGDTGADLIAYANLQVAYKKYVDAGLHYNREWTRDPHMTERGDPGKSYADAAQAYLSVVGAEASLSAPYAGRLWISPSYISVKNGWALSGYGGTEVMHGQGGLGIATNYLQWNGDPPSSTGSGSMLNLGFLYENTLSNILGKAPGSMLPDVRLNIFGLLADASLDLPGGSVITLKNLKQLKYGADVTVQALSWFAVMLRGDTVNYDMDHPAYIFSAITGRLMFASHFLSGESIYLQYSRYIYGDRMVLAGKWPTPADGGSGWPLVAGTEVLQGGLYAGKKPDENVIKLQATVAF
jgi:hypothetical protein